VHNACASAGKEQLLEMIRFGADSVINMSGVDTDMDLQQVLDQGTIQTQELTQRLKSMAATSMSDNFRSDGGKSFKHQSSDDVGGGGEVVLGGADEGLGSLAKDFVLEIGKRERKAVTYNDPGGKHDDSEEEGWSSKKQKSTTAGDADPTMKGGVCVLSFYLFVSMWW